MRAGQNTADGRAVGEAQDLPSGPCGQSGRFRLPRTRRVPKQDLVGLAPRGGTSALRRWRVRPTSPRRLAAGL